MYVACDVVFTMTTRIFYVFIYLLFLFIFYLFIIPIEDRKDWKRNYFQQNNKSERKRN